VAEAVQAERWHLQQQPTLLELSQLLLVQGVPLQLQPLALLVQMLQVVQLQA
jgi:hypothetical protein